MRFTLLGMMFRRTILALLLVLSLLGIAGTGAQESEYHGSLQFSCLHSAFLGASAYAPQPDKFPNVELRLTDALGRSAGAGSHNHPIPNSRYGRGTELPDDIKVNRKSVAVEICDAESGRYILNVTEHGTEWYSIVVKGEDGKYGNEARSLNVYPHGDRVCKYRFEFKKAKANVAIVWLNRDNRPLDFLQQPECEIVPRA